MKITLLTIGTRGEVQPCIALGLGLQAAGHQVNIATHATFETFVRDPGLGFSPINVDIEGFLNSKDGRAIMDSGHNLARTFQIFARTVKSLVLQIGTDCWAACQGADAILYTIGGFFFAPSIAEKLKVPTIGTYPYPASQPTRAFPNMFSPIQRNLGGTINRWTHVMIDALYWLPLRSTINQWRQEQLGLPPLGANYPKQVRQRQMPMLYGFSPNVVPKPPDWGDHVEVTGYWFLDGSADWQPPTDLVDFLEAEPPPVYVGFGSMSTREPEETTDLILQALAYTKQRGVLVTGWGGVAGISTSDVFVIDRVPFDWLFPQMAAVVHHGGSGTTAAGLRAGVPSIVVPFFMDQPFWGQRVADLGVGPQPIPHRRLSVERLAAAITTAITDKEMQRRAAALGECIRAEDGIARAVEVISHSGAS